AQEAWSRPDIPLHAQAMLRNPRPGLSNALEELQRLRALGNPIAFVGDIVGTGSSRKSAVNSLLWHIGQSVPYVPNKSVGGVVLAGKIAPIFFNTLEDAGALPIECDVSTLAMGDTLAVYPHTGKICDRSGNVIADFQLKTNVLLDEVRAGGRIPLIVGRTLTERAREHLGLPPSEVFASPVQHQSERAYSLAQKIVGRACGTDGISPGTYCEPRVSTVGSQDTTGPMTRDELTELACSGFAADLVLQTFCHTVAYPKPVDVTTQRTLPDFMTHRGGVSLRPGDGIIHSWLNRMLLPDQVGTGADSHTRFPLGISFPAGSGLVAFAAAMGVMPLDMPESVRVRFVGERQPGVTLRDLVNAIPYVASQRGLLTVSGRESTSPGSAANVFSGRILEVEGLGDLTVEQAFEFSDATAERSAAGCTFELSVDSVARYLRSNVVMLRWMIDQGYQDARALRRRAEAMEAWLAAPELLRADRGATYVAEIDIDMTSIVEPLLACPNDPDDVRTLSAVSGQKIDEVFIGSCMTNIGHFRAAGELLKDVEAVMPTRLWLAPPTKMDETTLRNEGYYSVYAKAGARTEMPGCSLCMGNQARVAPGAVVVSTSTRNFPNRLGQGAQVYLASAELAAVAAVLGRLPTSAEYATRMAGLDPLRGEIYRYMDFDKMPAFVAPTATAVSAPVRLGLH
ncbi:MAG: bifunctional aconitate hydratase 2/2-methylisocitrate dehydratase, partial [Gammaproteobacteria bacterium]|nr:bifunctional aconitate hydratase 2/2-methylisocitrate dehydratase [Gammaproteobacteria bacterium]